MGVAAELGGAVLRFEPELAGGHRDGCRMGDGAVDTGAVEAAATAVGLVGHRVEVSRNRGLRGGVLPKAVELGVVPVAAGLASQYLAGEECVTPDGEERLPVKHPGVERPEAHGVILADRAGTRVGPRASAWMRRFNQGKTPATTKVTREVVRWADRAGRLSVGPRGPRGGFAEAGPLGERGPAR